MFALIDCNNFYVSCERVFQPQWNNKPVVVLSNNDGCIISRSEEAKALGIPMGAPEFKYKSLLNAHRVKVFSSNYALYADMSNRVMQILKKYTPDIENYSIDEAFLNFKNTTTINYEQCGFIIKKDLQKSLSIPVCCGFASTKALSKVANRIAKKFPKETNGIYVIDNETKRIKALKWLKIEDVWGIGFRLKDKLRLRNITTAYDFTLPQNTAYIKQIMGVVGIRLQMELKGVSVLELDEAIQAKKNIAVTRTFEKPFKEFTDLRERISTFATVASEKLRNQKSCCYGIYVFLKKDKYKNLHTKYYYSNYKQLPFATQSSITLSSVAISMAKELYQDNCEYNKAGVILTEIIPEAQKQFHLFEEENPKHQKLMKVIDDIHIKTGERKIRLANQDLKKTWKMKQNFLSQKYTTKIDDLLEIKC